MMKIELAPRKWLLISVGVLLFIYIIFQARFIIFGPQISILTPRDGETVSTPAISVTGKTTNAAYITLNDRQIFTDQSGHFNEKLILAEGLSIMTVRVKDRFGREITKTVRIILE